MINIQYTFEAAVTRTVWRNKLEEHQKREAGRRAGENRLLIILYVINNILSIIS